MAEVSPVDVTIGDPSGAGSGSGSGSDGTATPTPVTIAVTLIDRPTDPAAYSFFVAYQDGSGPWTLAPAPTGDIYSFPVTSTTWGVAWGCKTSTANQWGVAFGFFATTERTTYTRPIPRSCTDRQSAPLASLTGSVTNLPSTGDGWLANFGDATSDVTRVTTTSGSFDFAGTARAGNHDLVGYHVVTTADGDYVDAASIVRSVTAPSTTAKLDWAMAAIKQSTIGVYNATGDVSFSTDLYTHGGTRVNLAYRFKTATGTAAFSSPSLTTAQTMTDDVYLQSVYAQATGTNVTMENWSNSGGARAFTLPEPFGSVVTSVVATAPYPQIKTQWSEYPDASGYMVLAQQFAADSSSRQWNAVIGPGYLDATPSFQLPDLSGLPGWKSEFGFKTGTAITGSVAALVTSAGISDVPGSYPAPAGTNRVRVATTFRVTP